MSTLAGLLHEHCDLEPADAQWLHRLVGHWQILADVAYTDLVLWAPTRDGRFVVVAICRPATAATGYLTDPVGRVVEAAHRPELVRAMAGRASSSHRAPGNWPDSDRPPVDAEPVVRDGRPIAVLTLRQRLGVLKLSKLERAYLQTAEDLLSMLREGGFPDPNAASGQRRGAPRVGDGLIRLDLDGVVTFASPNALSSFHRLGYMGGMVGELLAVIATDHVERSGLVDEALPLVVTGRADMHAMLLSKREVAVALHSIPLRSRGVRYGAVVLCRDVTEAYRGERELMTKDATIREIHHRVKNNLQTVSALLRMQARRIESKKAREALEEAMRRVATIALVHETLSAAIDETLDLDLLLTKVLALVRPLVWSGDGEVELRQIGRGGLVPAKEANALALVLMELVANAIEHHAGEANGPMVSVSVERQGSTLRVTVRDNGPGLPKRFSPGAGGLGTQIVTALVSGELGGTIEWSSPPEGGTLVELLCEVTERRGPRSSEEPGEGSGDDDGRP